MRPVCGGAGGQGSERPGRVVGLPCPDAAMTHRKACTQPPVALFARGCKKLQIRGRHLLTVAVVTRCRRRVTPIWLPFHLTVGVLRKHNLHIARKGGEGYESNALQAMAQLNKSHGRGARLRRKLYTALCRRQCRWMFVIVVINLNSFLAILVHQGLFIISPFILPWVERQEGR